MSGENIEQLKKYLEDNDYRTLLDFCCEPRPWKEISKLKIKNDKMFQVLKDLKTTNLLQFNDGKYFTPMFVKEYLK